jgi:drug/metabolite transporter (DMT)-like permease
MCSGVNEVLVNIISLQNYTKYHPLMNQKPTTTDYLKLQFIVAILGFTAILGRLTVISSLGVVFWRTLIAAAGMFIVAKLMKKNFALPFKKALPLLGIGVVMSLHWICFFGSARAATIAVSLVSFSTTSFFTSLIEPIVSKKKISWVEVFLGVLVVAGMYFVFKFEGKYLLGIIIGLIGAFLATIFSTINAKIANQYDAQLVTFYEMVGAFLGCFIYIPLIIFFSKEEFLLIPQGNDWLWIAILGLGCTVYPYIEMMKLLRKISAFMLNLSINLEPIYGIVLAYLVFGEKEKMTAGFYIGGVLILASVLLYPVLKRGKV